MRDRQHLQKFTLFNRSDKEDLIESFLLSKVKQQKVSPNELSQNANAPAIAERPLNIVSNDMSDVSGTAPQLLFNL